MSRATKMNISKTLCFCTIVFLAINTCVFHSQALALSLGHMKADSILFLGNSIALHGPYIGWSTEGDWGMAASEKSKDYVHLVTGSVEAATGGSLSIAHPEPLPGRWYYGDPLPNWDGNILNIADIFERNYDTWDNARIQNQINANPDIVVLQFGENLSGGSMAQLTTAMRTLVTGLKNQSNPHIFITSQIIEANPTVDAIKQLIVAEDPEHRVFVDLNGKVDLSGEAGHPNDPGMATIANELFTAMEAHATPEPGSLALLSTAGLFLGGCAWRRWKK